LAPFFFKHSAAANTGEPAVNILSIMIYQGLMG